MGKVATLIDRSAEKRGRELVDARVRSFGFGGWRLLDRLAHGINKLEVKICC